MAGADPEDPIHAAAARIVADNRSARNASSDRIARLIDAIRAADEEEFSDVVEDVLSETIAELSGPEGGEGPAGVDGSEAESSE